MNSKQESTVCTVKREDCKDQEIPKRNFPYYEQEFRERSDLLAITKPFDDIGGMVYLAKQMLTDPHQIAQDEQLIHHLQLLIQFKERLLRSQQHRVLVMQFASQFCILQLQKLGNLHLVKNTEFKDEFFTNKQATQARKLLLEMLVSLSMSPNFLEKGFGFKKMSNVDGTDLESASFKFDISKTFSVTEISLQQLIDEDTLAYLNQNTQNIYGLSEKCSGYLFDVESLASILSSMLFDDSTNQILAAAALSNISQDVYFQIQTQVQPRLASALDQLVQLYPVDSHGKFFDTLLTVFEGSMTLNSLASFVNSGGLRPIVVLSQDIQTQKRASGLLLDWLLTESGLCRSIFQLQKDLPRILLGNQQAGLDFCEEAVRLSVNLLRDGEFSREFSASIVQTLKDVREKTSIPDRLLLQIVNNAASNPASQQRIKESGVLNNLFQPETSGALVEGKPWWQ